MTFKCDNSIVLIRGAGISSPLADFFFMQIGKAFCDVM